MNVLAGLQNSFRIVCDLFDKGFWGEREGICPMVHVFKDLVKECDMCTEGQDTSCRQIVGLLRLGGWPGLDVCPLPHSLRQFQPATLCGWKAGQGLGTRLDGILEGGVGVSSGQDVVKSLDLVWIRLEVI